VAFAENEFALATTVGSTGQTKRHHFEMLQRGGFAVPELENAPKMPERLGYLWGAYIEIVNAGWSLGFSEIKAWSEMAGIEFKGWEVGALIKLERARNSKNA
jgi:hypothetical protein